MNEEDEKLIRKKWRRRCVLSIVGVIAILVHIAFFPKVLLLALIASAIGGTVYLCFYFFESCAEEEIRKKR